MPLRTLVAVALRLYAIYWFIDSISAFAVLVPMLVSLNNNMGGSGASYFYVLVPAGTLLLALLLWKLSSKLATLVTSEHDVQLDFASLRREDLYRFAFVLLGLYFVLSSVAQLVESGYQFFAYEYPLPDGNPQKGRYLWPLLSHVFTIVAGLVSLLGARNWTTKLIRLEDKNDLPPPAA